MAISDGLARNFPIIRPIVLGAAGFFLLFGLGYLQGAPAAEDNPVALVIEASPTIEPFPSPFSELSDGDELNLGDDGVVHLLHYYRCEELVIRGGKLALSVLAVSSRGGKVVTRRSKPCPKQVSVEPASVVSGVVLRHAAESVQVPVRPTMYVVGQGASRVDRIVVKVEGEQVLEFKVDGPELSWPEDAPSMGMGLVHELVLMDKDRKQLGSVRVRASDGTGAPVLLRVD